MENKLLELFDVENFEELDKFIEDNPEDPKVIELLETLNYMENNIED